MPQSTWDRIIVGVMTAYLVLAVIVAHVPWRVLVNSQDMEVVKLVVSILSTTATFSLAILAYRLSTRTASDTRKQAQAKAKLVAAYWCPTIGGAHRAMQELDGKLRRYEAQSDVNLYETCAGVVDKVTVDLPTSDDLAALALPFPQGMALVAKATGEMRALSVEIKRFEVTEPWEQQQAVQGAKYQQLWLPRVTYIAECLASAETEFAKAADFGPPYAAPATVAPWLAPVRMSHPSRATMASRARAKRDPT